MEITMQRLFSKSSYAAGKLVSGLMVAVLIGGCAAHQYKPAADYGQAVKVDAMKYKDDWFAAARAGRTDILQGLADAGFPLDIKTGDGYTALILAAYNNRPVAVQTLLTAGADACAADKRGNTALMGALFKGESDIATILAGAHCDIDQVNNAGETALSFAALFGRLDMVPVLVAHGADPNHKDARGGTVLKVVLDQGNEAAAEALRRAGATQ
jgi:ankyrin repeat protein